MTTRITTTTTTTTHVEFEADVTWRSSAYERAHAVAYVIGVVGSITIAVFARALGVVMALTLWACARLGEGALHVERELGGSRGQLTPALTGGKHKQLDD